MREVILRFDVCVHPLALLAVFVLARGAMRFRPRFAPAMAWSAIAIFLAAAALGYGEVRPPQGIQVLAILVSAGIAACAASLVVFVLSVPCAAVADRCALAAEQSREAQRTVRLLAEKQLKDELDLQRSMLEQQQAHAEQRAREEYQRQHPPPPPPTRDERAAGAKAHYERTVRMIEAAGLDAIEDRAARDEAKRLYLRELDSIWRES